MLTCRNVSCLTASVLVALSTASVVKAASSSDLIGTYSLVSAKNFGSSASGTLMFDANGRFSLIILRGDLPKYASNKRVEGTADEYKATVLGSLAYFGTYSVSGTDLIFNIEKSTFANWDGTQSKRIDLTVTAEEIKYTSPTPSAGGSPDQLVWKRIK